MASSSSSSSATPQLKKYDIFLSFRGEDTRFTFTTHLHAALCRKAIKTFIDNDLERGDEISTSLLNTIKASKISIIIFSQNYASSRWCLQELEQILDCKETKQQIVIPIFYNVDPSHVRNQKGSFGEGFAELQERFKEKPEMLKVKRWKSALNEAASLSGWTIDAKTSEFELTEAISRDILDRLNKLSPSDYAEGLVGVESSINKIESWLHKGSNGVSKIGIWGIGGIGKTTIARAVFKKILNQFERSYFAENVREESEQSTNLTHLRNELLSKLLDDKDPNIGVTYRRERLEALKVLIVFDDVTSFMQIENLIGNLDLSSESQIIITTRDKHVLSNCEVDDACIYKVEELREKEAHQLFNQYAFKQYSPIADYMELSKKAVAYTKGLPLALKVLGCHLYSRGKEFWESVINDLENNPLQEDVQKVLKVSYDGLGEEEKRLFLDIACFLEGEQEDLVKKSTMKILTDKCLVFVTDYNEIRMHDLLQEMGRKIAGGDTCKEIRLWRHEDVFKAFAKNKEIEAIRSISLDTSKIGNAEFDCRVLKMPNLRYLRVYDSQDNHEIKLKGFQHRQSFFNGLKSFMSFFRVYNSHEKKLKVFQHCMSYSNSLEFFSWSGYPFKSVPEHFPSKSLVELNMPFNKVKHWNVVQDLENLKYVDLRHSEHMKEIPNFSKASNLEHLVLRDCKSLLRITSSSIQNLNKLYFLDLAGCSRLTSLPDGISKWKLLEELNLINCSKLERLPHDIGDLEALEVLGAIGTALKELPPSILYLPKLRALEISRDDELAPLNWVLNYSSGSSSRDVDDQPAPLNPVLNTSSWSRPLSYLILENCQITKLPECLGEFSLLELLDLRGNNFESIPESIKELSKLYLLNITNCRSLKLLPDLPLGVNVIASDCLSLQSIPHPSFLLLPDSRPWQANFSNCFELDSRKILDQVKDSWGKLYADICFPGNETPKWLCAEMYFPGNEIPKWFTIQSREDYIALDQSLDWDNENFQGFFTSAVVYPNELDNFHDYRVAWSKVKMVRSEFSKITLHLGILMRKKGMIGYIRMSAKNLIRVLCCKTMLIT
ncbi:disease resistance-like protein DSC1 [Pistacia vera]|uniref:disease resistance-like protein DSC1 n=1 Tax=Pistacia vera TaxID=55513 RepID=UPI0012633747|nr:disease resistance-like protein DSC1 [Pistacia vera]